MTTKFIRADAIENGDKIMLDGFNYRQYEISVFSAYKKTRATVILEGSIYGEPSGEIELASYKSVELLYRKDGLI